MSPINRWFWSHPLSVVLVGIVVVAAGLLASRPIAIGVGVVVVVLGLVRTIL